MTLNKMRSEPLSNDVKNKQRRAVRRHRLFRSRATIFTWWLVIVAGTLAVWQYGPESNWLRDKLPFFDPFFISSPSRIWVYMGKLMTGSNGISSVWPFLGYTLRATLIGVGAGVLAGVAVGLLLSHSETTAKVFAPFITLINATPRIAIIPIIAIIAGPTITTTAISSFLVVFFIAFYNGYAGGRSVRPEIIQNARLLGASPIEIMLQIRLPYVAAWTFASLPNAISFGLTTVVTAELLTGQPGMGQLITDALTNSNATLTFSVVVLLAVAGLLLVIASDAVQKRVLHWWER